MIEVKLISLDDVNDMSVTTHINGNDIECTMTFNPNELSQATRDAIVALLQKEFDGMATREQINKLPR